MYGTIQIKLNEPDWVMDYLVHQCREANSLINCALFGIRQQHFAECPTRQFFDREDNYREALKLRRVKASYANLCAELKDNPHYKLLGGQCAQQVLKSVAESFTSFNQLLGLFFQGEGDKPRMPGYRTKGGLAPLAFPAQAVKLDRHTGQCRLPVSKENAPSYAEHLSKDRLWIAGCTGIRPEQLAEVRILPRNGALYAEYVYKHGNDGPTCSLDLDPAQALGIDPGVTNWLTCVSSQGKSFILDGCKLKSINQWYNKRVAAIKTGKPEGYWDDELAKLTEKRNLQMRDAINKAARFVVNYCLHHRLGRVVFGWNTGVKLEANLGGVNNQNFVQIPTARLKNRIRQLCEEQGIQFVETEESYTSKASALDRDVLPTFGSEKPASWQPSGKRISRGTYRTAQGQLVSADANGALNIIRKVATQLGVTLAEVGRGSLTLPKRYDLSCLRRSYRAQAESHAFKRG